MEEYKKNLLAGAEDGDDDDDEDSEEEEEEEEAAEPSPAKKAKPADPQVPESDTKVLDEAKKLGFAAKLRVLLANEKIKASSLQILDALKAAEGSVVAAKTALKLAGA